MSKAKKKLWLWRESAEGYDFYFAGASDKKPPIPFALNWLSICVKQFESVAPRELHLKPGQGPIPIKLVLDKPAKKSGE